MRSAWMANGCFDLRLAMPLWTLAGINVVRATADQDGIYI
jgi:hypothetical protein